MDNDSGNALTSILLICALIHSYNSARQRYYLTRSGILHPKFSPWEKLCLYGDENSFLTMTGFSRFAFMNLVDIMFP